MNYLQYLLEANLYLSFFYLLYYFVLRKETFYQLNRLYLLFSSLAAFILPLVQLGMLRPSILQQRPYTAAIEQPPGTLNTYILVVYIAVTTILLLNFGIKIYKLVWLAINNKSGVNADYKLIIAPGKNNAFSFFSNLFVSDDMVCSSTVIQHELIHIKQRHSFDIVFFEIIKILSWFNPLVYLLQNSVKELHEFIADRETADLNSGADIYTDFLISNAYNITGNSITNNFFNKSQLKKRIIMLHQKRSDKSARLKYLLALPLIGASLCVSTLAFSKSYGVVDVLPQQDDTIHRTLPPPPPPAPPKVGMKVPPRIRMNGKPLPPPPQPPKTNAKISSPV